MKKTWLLVLAVAVLVCLPLTAQAKTEFELGGYIRLDAMWNSQQGINYALSNYSVRNNAANGGNHGKFMMNANATRFNFTVKGPELWGGKVTGFIEVDFDGGDTVNIGRAIGGRQNSWVAVNDSSFGQAKLRLRHAMFKMAWSDREIIFGQFWSINSEMIPDTADSGAYCLYGSTQLRIPQVRYTQKFGNGFDASLAIEAPQNGRWGLNVDATNQIEGEVSETPMVEAKVRFEQDLYGKAAWMGKPRGFYVGVGAGYLRTRSAPVNFAAGDWQTWGQINFQAPGVAMNVNQSQYQNHWLVLIENFTPIIPTTTKSLAGTLGLGHQWWIGQGVSAWRLDLPGSDRFYTFRGFEAVPGNFNYNLNFVKRYGGHAQLQYYWTEEIYTNINFGFQKAWGINQQRDAFLAAAMAGNPAGFVYANPLGYDTIVSAWRAGVTQWYRPIPAVKFGLQYTYMRTNYFQNTTVGSSMSKYGDNHSLMANAWYMF